MSLLLYETIVTKYPNYSEILRFRVHSLFCYHLVARWGNSLVMAKSQVILPLLLAQMLVSFRLVVIHILLKAMHSLKQ